MRSLFFPWFIIFLTLVFSPLSLASAQIAFENVTVISMSGTETKSPQTVLIEGDRIRRIGSDIDLPEGTDIIDGRGKFLMPGLTEMHGHVPPLSSSEQAVRDTLFLYVANGVTTVRGMLGTPGQLSLRDDPVWQDDPAPTLYLAGPSFNGSSVFSPAQARRKVAEQIEQGWDLLKIHPGLSQEEYLAMAQSAHTLNIDFGGHVPADVTIETALRARQRTIDHIDGYIEAVNGARNAKTINDFRALAKRTKEAGVGIVPTMAVWESLLGAIPLEERMKFDEIKYVSARTIDGWRRFFTQERSIGFLAGSDPHIRHQNRIALLAALYEEGAEILFGTDAPQVFSVPGFSIHREFPIMKEAGMSNYDILKSATGTIGDHFRDKDTFGTLTEGYRADMVLLGNNPLEDLDALKAPHGVMIRGRWIDRDAIEAGLLDIETRMEATR